MFSTHSKTQFQFEWVSSGVLPFIRMFVKTMTLLQINFEGSLPVWSDAPTRPLEENLLVGHIHDCDVIFLIHENDDGTSQVLTRLGLVWLVSAFVCKIQ